MEFVFQNLTNDKQLNEKFFKKILEIAASELNLENKNISISLNLVGEGRIKELNKKYRNKNKIQMFYLFPFDSLRSLRAS